MSWYFQNIAKTSALSKSTFLDGEQVVCLIYKNFETGEIGRADIRFEEMDHFELPGDLLGRWFRKIKKTENGQAMVRQRVASAEDFFISLYESPDRPDSDEETNALKHLIALMLERKRVIRVQGKRQHSGVQTYIHIKTKQTFDVPIVHISTDLMSRIQQTVGDILL
jgi:hypothetical protein